jgi:hypothetical protein
MAGGFTINIGSQHKADRTDRPGWKMADSQCIIRGMEKLVALSIIVTIIVFAGTYTLSALKSPARRK